MKHSLRTLSTTVQIVLGVDVSQFTYAFDEHTRFVRQIIRLAGHAANPTVVLQNQEMVNEIQGKIGTNRNSLIDVVFVRCFKTTR